MRLNFDLLGHILGAALRRKLAADAKAAYDGPVGQMVKAVAQPLASAALEAEKANLTAKLNTAAAKSASPIAQAFAQDVAALVASMQVKL